MKTYTTLFFLFCTFMGFSPATRAELAANFEVVCTATEVNTIYIPMLRDTVDWPDDMIRPYALSLCQLTKQKKALQKSISTRANNTRTGNWRICKEVIPGNPSPTDAECKTAYNQKVNDLIDQCISLIGLGHNPHNVMLIIDPIKVEVSCLKGVDIMFQ